MKILSHFFAILSEGNGYYESLLYLYASKDVDIYSLIFPFYTDGSILHMCFPTCIVHFRLIISWTNALADKTYEGDTGTGKLR